MPFWAITLVAPLRILPPGLFSSVSVTGPAKPASSCPLEFSTETTRLKEASAAMLPVG